MVFFSFNVAPSYQVLLLLVALFFPLSWLFRLPHILTQIEQDGIRFWTWRGKQFVAWSEFIEFDYKAQKLIFHTTQKTHTWNLRWHKPKIDEEYFFLVKARVPMTTGLRVLYEEYAAEKQNGIDYSDWPSGELVSLPIQTRIHPLVIGFMLIATALFTVPLVIGFSEGDIAEDLSGILFLSALILFGIGSTIWMLLQSITIDEQGVQVRNILGCSAIAWREVEFVANNNLPQALRDFIVLEGSQKRLIVSLSMHKDTKRIKQAVLQKMRQYQLPLKPITPEQLKSRNVKI